MPDRPTIFSPEQANVGLFCDVFPPVMDGVSVCMENYAYWIQKKVGGVAVITPNVPGTDYSVHDYKVYDYLSVPVPMRHLPREGGDDPFQDPARALSFRVRCRRHAHRPPAEDSGRGHVPFQVP